jgi:cytochrome b561
MTSPAQWPKRVVLIHWLTFLVVLGVFAFVLSREFIESREVRQSLLTLHRYAGLTALVLVLLRIPTRLSAQQPEHGLAPLTRKLAAAGHGLLYLALIATPLLGYALACARTGHVDYFGLPLPVLFGKDRDLADQLEGIHSLLGWAMLALVTLHVAAALWHHLVIKDGVLLSMIRRKRAHS